MRASNNRQPSRLKWWWIPAAVAAAAAAVLYWEFRTPANIEPVTVMHPVVLQKQQQLIAETGKTGIKILITDGLRTIEEQDSLYRQGRSDEGRIVTTVKGGNSYHNYGLAIDFALWNKSDEVIWDMEYDGNGNGKSDWMEVVAIAKSIGFSWGGDWEEFRDYPHLQMDFGYSIRELKRGKRPPADIAAP